MTIIAIIDMGSNAIRLTIYETLTNEATKVIEKHTAFTRLSEGMSSGGVIAAGKIAEAVVVLAGFSKIMKRLGVQRYQAIATAAARRAVNRAVLFERIASETGIKMALITGEQEATYDFLGVKKGLPNLQEAVIIDTGGGSCELIYMKKGEISALVSLPMGAVTLTNQFGTATYEWSSERLVQMETQIETAFEKLIFLQEAKGVPCVAVGGSNRSVARVANGNEQAVHAQLMDTAEVLSIIATIQSSRLVQRQAIPALGKKRSETIVAGLAPLKVLLKYIDSPQLVFSEYGLKEGVLESICRQINE